MVQCNAKEKEKTMQRRFSNLFQRSPIFVSEFLIGIVVCSLWDDDNTNEFQKMLLDMRFMI